MSPYGNLDMWFVSVMCITLVANKGDNLNRRPVFYKQTRIWQKNRKKIVIFSFLKRVKSILGKIVTE